MSGVDIPLIIAHLDHQSRRIRAEVFDADTGRAWHRALDLQYNPRSTSATSASIFPWSGVTSNGNRVNEIGNGRYVIRLTVEKALAQESDATHFETWTSPVITIARP